MAKSKWKHLLALCMALALVVAACGGDDDDDDAGAGNDTETTEAVDGGDEESCIGEPECVPPNQPDVNQDGTVKIGILSPGDTEDNGYYESFVVTAREFADANDWELIIQDQINPADAQEQARNICRQGVDMVAIAAGELADAVPVAEEDVCAGTVWYVSGGAGIEQTPYFFQTNDDVFESQYATGVATGVVMEALGVTKAGFVTGPELDFAINAFNAWTAGIKSVLPDAETVATYTGDFDDSAVGQEGAQAQLDQGVGIMYPYLGGATDAVKELAFGSNVLSITPGTDRCAEPEFAISSIFSPGDFFAAALTDFEAGKVTLGVTKTFQIGVDDVPTVKICDSVDGAADLQSSVDDVIAKIASGEIDPAAESGATG